MSWIELLLFSRHLPIRNGDGSAIDNLQWQFRTCVRHMNLFKSGDDHIIFLLSFIITMIYGIYICYIYMLINFLILNLSYLIFELSP